MFSERRLQFSNRQGKGGQLPWTIFFLISWQSPYNKNLINPWKWFGHDVRAYLPGRPVNSTEWIQSAGWITHSGPTAQRPGHHCFLLNFPSPASRGHQRNSVSSLGAWMEIKVWDRSPGRKGCKQVIEPCLTVGTAYCDWVLFLSCPEITFCYSVLLKWLKAQSRLFIEATLTNKLKLLVKCRLYLCVNLIEALESFLEQK